MQLLGGYFWCCLLKYFESTNPNIHSSAWRQIGLIVSLMQLNKQQCMQAEPVKPLSPQTDSLPVPKLESMTGQLHRVFIFSFFLRNPESITLTQNGLHCRSRIAEIDVSLRLLRIASFLNGTERRARETTAGSWRVRGLLKVQVGLPWPDELQHMLPMIYPSCVFLAIQRARL